MSALAGVSVLSRRRALKLGLGVFGAVATGGTAGLFAIRGRAPSTAGLSYLDDHHYRTLTALAVALFPDGGAFAAGASTADLARVFDRFLEGEPHDRRSDLKRALTLLEYGPLLYERRLTTFSNLAPEERLRHFERWTTSDSLVRRQVALAFRKFLCIVFYDRPELWPDIGYSIAPSGGPP